MGSLKGRLTAVWGNHFFSKKPLYRHDMANSQKDRALHLLNIRWCAFAALNDLQVPFGGECVKAPREPNRDLNINTSPNPIPISLFHISL